jgi:WD40 repeat protein
VYRFDRVLIDPTPKALSQALAEASDAANKGVRARLLSWPPDDFNAFVKAWRAAPEGQRQWNAPGAFRKKGYAGDKHSAAAVVWWSDPLRRKHCRVVSERIECAGPLETDLFEPERYRRYPDRPVLWRVYPDDLYLREQAGKWELWAACRCGASGPPEELGWMGPWCAACHDRAEEGKPLTRPGVCRAVTFSGHPFTVGDVAFCPDGRTVLARVDCYPEVWVWDTLTGAVQKRRFPGRPKNTQSKGLAVAPDGRMAAVCMGAQVRLWSPLDGKDGPSGPVLVDHPGNDGIALAFSPDGKLLASAVRVQNWSPTRITLHDLATGQPLRTLSLDGGLCFESGQRLAFSPDGQTLALGWGRPMVRLWDVVTGQELPSPPGDAEYVGPVAYSPDGKTLAVGLEWGGAGLRLWDVASGKVKAFLQEGVGALAFSPDSRVLATVAFDGCLRLRRADDGQLLSAFRWHQASIDAVAFSPDGRWLVTGAKEDRVKLWPVEALLNQQGGGTRARNTT